ncbi:ecdysone oxidase-like [Pieris napi]|uniref:ecdysone oxidase-like n=1 Tax=Pieris napi TaxID=78633 RepID=UPI001FBA658A|nr:ecdysone oxidase-like [Pieris napi]XP_047517677.1 ecdysone oxidase-like [Pieris napi]
METYGAWGGGAAGATIAAALNYFAAAQCLLREPWPPQANLENGTVFDFIVVGGGTAGAALASRLSELRDHTVLLLEAGGDPPLESIIPGFRDAMKQSAVDWNFTTTNDNFSSQALRDGSQRQPRGKMLGGSGSINDMIYSRGFPADYDEWAAELGEDWNWKNVLKKFKRTEHLTDERIINNPYLTQFHGFGGEIEVAGFNESTRATDEFLAAFKEMGFSIVPDMTNPYEIGAGRFSHTIREGRRESSVTALLNSAANRDNLYVLKKSFVSKILIEQNKAYGVQVLQDNKTLNFYATRDIIVSAGTFNTAKLLLLSGVGPKEHLKEMGVDVVADLPVGDNLHDHIMVLNFISAEEGTCQKNENEHYLDIIEYLYDRRGFFQKTSDLAAYVSYNSSTPNVPDFAFYPTCMGKNNDFYEACTNILGFKSYICERITSANIVKEILIVAVVNLKPQSRGRVRLKSRDPLDSPLIFSGTFSDEKDLMHYPAAIRTARAIANSTYFRKKKAEVIDLELEECKGNDGDDMLRCWAKSMATSAWHAVGTAALGSVLDSKLRVRGVRNLRVADASVMPTIIRGNTNAPVIMIAEMAAEFIKESLHLL